MDKNKKSIKGFLGNIGKSGLTNTKDVLSSVINILNPNMEKNTVANLGRLGIDTAKLIGGDKDQNNRARLVGEFYKNRYGGLDKLGETAYNDPVGVLLDASTVIGGAGALAKGAGAVTKSSKLAALGGMADDVARSIDPISQATKIVGKGGSKVADVTRGTRTNLAEKLAVKSARANPSQLNKFSDLTGQDLGKFMVEKKVLNKSAVQNAIKPLQEEYNKLVRSDKTISGEKYAENLVKKALEIEKNDRSPSARTLTQKLIEEADTQSGLGNITDTVLTNTKSNQFNKVPSGQMIDPMSDSLNKILGEVGIKTLEEVSPGSSAIGKQLQAYRQLEEILKKQGELGKGSQLFNILKPSFAGFAGGAGIGSILPGVGTGAGAVAGGITNAIINQPFFQKGAANLLSNGISIPSVVKDASNVALDYGRAGRMNVIDRSNNQSTTPTESSQELTVGKKQSMKPYTQDTNNFQSQSQEQFDPNEQITLIDGTKSTYGQLQQQGVFNQGQVLGEQESQTPITDEQFQQLFIADLLQNGGKNLDKLTTIQKLMAPQNDLDTQMKQLQLAKLQREVSGSAEKPLSAEQQKMALNAQSGLDAIKTIREVAGEGVPITASLPDYLGGNQAYQAAVNNVTDAVGRLRSGGAINADEEKRFMNLLPKVGDNKKTIDYKLNQVEKLLSSFAYKQSSAAFEPSGEEQIFQMLGM